MPYEYTFEETVTPSIFQSIDALDKETDIGKGFTDKAEPGPLLCYEIPDNQLVRKPKLLQHHIFSNTLGDPGGHQKSSCFDV